MSSEDPILQFFSYSHLPPNLAAVSKPFCDLARGIAGSDGADVFTCDILPQNPEREAALRKLLEAKDAAVRALLSK